MENFFRFWYEVVLWRKNFSTKTAQSIVGFHFIVLLMEFEILKVIFIREVNIKVFMFEITLCLDFSINASAKPKT